MYASVSLLSRSNLTSSGNKSTLERSTSLYILYLLSWSASSSTVLESRLITAEGGFGAERTVDRRRAAAQDGFFVPAVEPIGPC
jgi:hypothetical protein